MSNILPTNKITTPTVEVDKEQTLKRTVNQIQNMAKECYNTMVRTQRRGIDTIWGNEHVTPQEIFDVLGDTGPKLVEFHSKLTTLIVEAATMDGVEVDIKLPENAMEVVDGKIIVTEDPYEIPQ
jgi:hypothetical protein